MADDPDSAVKSQLDVLDERLSLTVAGDVIGDWSLNELVMSRNGDALQIEVEDSTVVFVTSEPDRLVRVIGLPEESEDVEAGRSQKAKRKVRPRRPVGQSPLVKEISRFLGSLSTKVKLAAGLGLVALIFAIVAPRLFATILAVLGAVGVLLAIVALLDPLVEARIPGSWPPARVLALSAGVLTVGVVIGALI